MEFTYKKTTLNVQEGFDFDQELRIKMLSGDAGMIVYLSQQQVEELVENLQITLSIQKGEL